MVLQGFFMKSIFCMRNLNLTTIIISSDDDDSHSATHTFLYWQCFYEINLCWTCLFKTSILFTSKKKKFIRNISSLAYYKNLKNIKKFMHIVRVVLVHQQVKRGLFVFNNSYFIVDYVTMRNNAESRPVELIEKLQKREVVEDVSSISAD